MEKKQFVKTTLLSSLLFFVFSLAIDFLLTWEIHDFLSYIILFVLSLLVFGPMIAILVTDYKETHHKKDINLQV